VTIDRPKARAIIAKGLRRDDGVAVSKKASRPRGSTPIELAECRKSNGRRWGCARGVR